jgi:hypothetical protein
MRDSRMEIDRPLDDSALIRAASSPAPIMLPGVLDAEASHQLTRMFRDPRVLEPEERTALVARLREAVALTPHVAEVKVLLGMALSVDLQAQEALEVLRAATRQAPDCFIARLKFGELLMRLRVCSQAEEQTHQAALLASNAAQSELARRQAAAIRVLLREGVERGGLGGILPRIFGSRFRKSSTPALAAAK